MDLRVNLCITTGHWFTVGVYKLKIIYKTNLKMLQS